MSAGMILLTVLVILFMVIVVLPIIGGAIGGSIVLMRNALRKMRSTSKVSAPVMEMELLSKSAPDYPEIETVRDNTLAGTKQVAHEKTGGSNQS